MLTKWSDQSPRISASSVKDKCVHCLILKSTVICLKFERAMSIHFLFGALLYKNAACKNFLRKHFLPDSITNLIPSHAFRGNVIKYVLVSRVFLPVKIGFTLNTSRLKNETFKQTNNSCHLSVLINSVEINVVIYTSFSYRNYWILEPNFFLWFRCTLFLNWDGKLKCDTCLFPVAYGNLLASRSPHSSDLWYQS